MQKENVRSAKNLKDLSACLRQVFRRKPGTDVFAPAISEAKNGVYGGDKRSEGRIF